MVVRVTGYYTNLANSRCRYGCRDILMEIIFPFLAPGVAPQISEMPVVIKFWENCQRIEDNTNRLPR